MEKLEFKKITPYLPYGLSVQFAGELDDNNIRIDTNYIKIGEVTKLGSVEFRYTNPIYWMDFKRGYFGVNSVNIKPILRPLSDLTKEINYGLSTYVFTDLFEIGDCDGCVFEFEHGNIKTIKALENISKYNSYKDINYLPNAVVNMMYEHHFDVFGLIEKGLAIDINTLKQKKLK